MSAANIVSFQLYPGVRQIFRAARPEVLAVLRDAAANPTGWFVEFRHRRYVREPRQERTEDCSDALRLQVHGEAPADMETVAQRLSAAAQRLSAEVS